jgi:3-ketosteroid 9alpha-monooxygenase subunit A
MEVLMTSRFPRSPYPTGWFQVGWSHELAPGEVKPLQYFGQHLVIWRGVSGEVFLQDAFCLHLGAHRGVRGTVAGDDLVCPWHGWQWDGEGRNSKIPYGDDGCKRNLKVRTYPVVEWHGIIAAWYSPDETDPQWQLPRVPEAEREDFYPMMPDGATKYRVKAHVQMPVENAVDPAHIQFVHGASQVPEVVEFQTHDHQFDVEVAVTYGGDRTSTELTPQGAKVASFRISHEGLGFGVIRWDDALWPTIAIAAFTPVDDEYIDYFYQQASKREDGMTGNVPAGRAARMLKVQRAVVEQDFFAWENMKYLDRATFASLEAKNYGSLRDWAMQFYPQSDEVRLPENRDERRSPLESAELSR